MKRNSPKKSAPTVSPLDCPMAVVNWGRGAGYVARAGNERKTPNLCSSSERRDCGVKKGRAPASELELPELLSAIGFDSFKGITFFLALAVVVHLERGVDAGVTQTVGGVPGGELCVDGL